MRGKVGFWGVFLLGDMDWLGGDKRKGKGGEAGGGFVVDGAD